MNLAQFLSSISIENAGEHTFDMIIEEGYTTIDQINGMTIQQIADIGKVSKKTIGEKTAKRIWDSLHSVRVQELLPYADLWIEKEPSMEDISAAFKGVETPTGYKPDRVSFIVKNGENLLDVAKKMEGGTNELKMDLQGNKVLFTGKGEYSRDALTNILKRNGAIIQKSVTKETDILILSDLESNSNKAKKARKYGTKMVTYQDVLGE